MSNLTVTSAVDTFMESADQAAMRTSLALGGSATLDVGTTTGTVAAGDDARFLKPFAIVTESGTSRTLLLSDAQKYIRCTNGSAVTITIPPQSSVVWLADTEIIIEQAGAGQVTVAGGSGVDVRTSETLKTSAQYASITLKRVAEDEWVCGGEREAA